MLAGIFLGPSLLGLGRALACGLALSRGDPSAPCRREPSSEWSSSCSSWDSRSTPTLLRERGRTALITSQAGILVPFASGALLGLFSIRRSLPRASIGLHFVLFMGTAMSITAFPVLGANSRRARSFGIEPRHLALASAAIDDVFGWSMLSIVVLLTRANAVGTSVATTLFGLLAFAGALLLVSQAALAAIGGRLRSARAP